MVARVVEKNALGIVEVLRGMLDRRQFAAVVVMARLANIAIEHEPGNLCTYIYRVLDT